MAGAGLKLAPECRWNIHHLPGPALQTCTSEFFKACCWNGKWHLSVEICQLLQLNNGVSREIVNLQQSKLEVLQTATTCNVKSVLWYTFTAYLIQERGKSWCTLKENFIHLWNNLYWYKLKFSLLWWRCQLSKDQEDSHCTPWYMCLSPGSFAHPHWDLRL